FSVVTVAGTAAADVINVSRSGGSINVTLNGATTSYAASGVTEVDVSGGAGNDTIAAAADFNIPLVVVGGDGSDTITGGAAADRIYGNAGSDTISGGLGNDTLYAGNAPFDPTIFTTVKLSTLLQKNVSRPWTKSTISGIKLSPTIKLNPLLKASTPVAGPSLASGVLTNTSAGTSIGQVGPVVGTNIGTTIGTNIILKPGVSITDRPIITIPNLPGLFVDNDVVYGNEGNDTLYGGPGTSTLYGHAGNDTIYGGTGDNTAFGGTGDDVIKGGGTKVNNLWGEDGNDVVEGSKSGGTNHVFGGNGNDRLFARGYGANDVHGGAGNDSLFAGPAASSLFGDDGDDVLVSIGGSHADSLTGGNGLDYFWCDTEATEKMTDVNLFEALGGTAHRVGSFANGASRERLGQNITDPESSRLNDDGTKYYPSSANFADHPLFASAGPAEDDVRQGQNGDCYFLAGLSATAKTDQIAIRKSVVDLGDGTYAVQFWKNGVASFYRVDADLPTWQGTSSPYNAGFGAEGSMWVPVMEKAFAHFRTGANSYQSIWYGSDEAFKALNGKQIADVTGSNATQMLMNIRAALLANKQVIAGTPDTAPTNGAPVVKGHMYTVDRVNTTTVKLLGMTFTVPTGIVLRNPWGYDGAGSDSNTGDGYVTCTPEQFYGYFTYVRSALV
ncbi:MAG TPA: C2 family cysteine protease, partial [Humisphaera sp.]